MNKQFLTRAAMTLLVALLGSATGAWAQYSGGSGTEDSPYLINSEADWITLCTNVNNNSKNYSDEFFKLMADITVSEEFTGAPTKMVGRGENMNFRGTFDGDGHTLTLDYSATSEYAAPFRFVDDATIRNLTVAGTITTAKKFAAGIIGQAAGIVNINHCRSSVTINSSIAGDGTNGGFVGLIHDGETRIRGSLFDGRLLGRLTESNGGFVGWAANGDSLTIENSIFDPSEVTMVGEKTFARCSSDEHPTITNCFYTKTFGGVQGKRIYKNQQEVADNGLYYVLPSFDKTYYGKIIVTMQLSFDQAVEEVKPVPTLMTEDGILIPEEDIYTLDWHEAAGTYTVSITAVPSAQFSIPDAARSSSAEPAALPPAPVLPFIHISGKVAPKGRRKTMVSTNRLMVSTNRPMVSTNRPMVSTNRPMVLTIVFCRPFGTFAAPTMMRRVFAAPSALVKGLMGGGSGNLKMIHALPTERAEVPKKNILSRTLTCCDCA